MKHLVARFTAKPGHELAVGELLAELTAQVRAEPGCVRFDPFTHADRPAEYFVIEAYADEDAFAQHLSSPHSRDFNGRLSGLVEGAGSDLTFLAPLATVAPQRP